MQQPNRPAAQPLVFQDVTFNVIDRSGEPWLRYHQIADAFGYTTPRSLNVLYNRYKDEFTSLMTTVIELDTPGGRQPVRIFSLRGAHLLGMFARTDRAKEFRRWVLNILEQYQQPGPTVLALPPPPQIDKDTELSIKQRAKVLADSWYVAYCLQMRHQIKSGGFAAAHVASWMPGQEPTAAPTLPIILSGPNIRHMCWYDKNGVLKSQTMSDCTVVSTQVWRALIEDADALKELAYVVEKRILAATASVVSNNLV